MKINLKKIYIIMIVIYIFSYVLKSINSFLPNLTIGSYLISLILFTCIVLKRKEQKTLYKEDVILFFFIIYIFLQGLFLNNIEKNLEVIINSIGVYYLGREINFNNLKSRNKLLKAILLIGAFFIVLIINKYFFSENKYRISIGNPIAIGEMIGITALVSFFYYIEKKRKLYLSIFLLGLACNFVVLASRSSAFLILISIFLTYFIKLKGKSRLKVLVTIIIILIMYLIFFREGSYLIKAFPQLNRFTIEGMLTDPSVVGYGSRSNINEGRVYNLKNAINEFKKNILVGTGVGNNYAHNIFVEILGSLGLVGFFYFFIFILEIIKKLWNEEDYILLSLFIYVFLYRQFSFGLSAHKNLFLLCGIIVSQRRIINKIKFKRIKN